MAARSASKGLEFCSDASSPSPPWTEAVGPTRSSVLSARRDAAGDACRRVRRPSGLRPAGRLGGDAPAAAEHVAGDRQLMGCPNVVAGVMQHQVLEAAISPSSHSQAQASADLSSFDSIQLRPTSGRSARRRSTIDPGVQRTYSSTGRSSLRTINHMNQRRNFHKRKLKCRIFPSVGRSFSKPVAIDRDPVSIVRCTSWLYAFQTNDMVAIRVERRRP